MRTYDSEKYRAWMQDMKQNHPEKYRARLDYQKKWRIKYFMAHPEKYEENLAYQREWYRRKRIDELNRSSRDSSGSVPQS